LEDTVKNIASFLELKKLNYIFLFPESRNGERLEKISSAQKLDINIEWSILLVYSIWKSRVYFCHPIKVILLFGVIQSFLNYVNNIIFLK